MRLFSLILVYLLLGPAALAADAVPATGYFPVLPYDAPPEALPQLVPVASSHALDQLHPGVTRAVIAIHDETRDANAALAGLSALAGAANAATMIVAPQFLLPSDLARFAGHLPEHGRMFAVWDAGAWRWGGESVAVQGRKSLSSFTVVDLLLMYLADRARFPDLKLVIIAGFGAGADFVQRYAAFSTAPDIAGQQTIDLRYLVAGASSYLYLTAARNLGGAKGLGRPDPAACPGYNAYPYGLENLNAYARRAGANQAKTDYALHFITYIDTAASGAFPDTGCAALAQGADSAARTANYRGYLQSLYGDVAARTQIFSRPADANNDEIGLFGSDCGMAVLFGDGICIHAFGEDK